MPFADLVMLGVFLCMTAVIVVDQRVFAPAAARPEPPAPAPEPPAPAPEEGQPAAAEPARDPDPAPPALPAGEDLTRLLPGAAGWAFVSSAGELLASNLPRRAALLSAACAALQLEVHGDEAARGPLRAWTITRVEGPTGALLGEASADGVILAVLVRAGTDETPLREGMSAALSAVSASVQAVAPGPAAMQLLEAAAEP